MASLVRPVVPGATSIGNVIAQAQAAANAQSAQILAAANNIARNRQRAGERAADAVVQMRLEAFQREQFNQKKLIQDEQLKLAQSANQRANKADARAAERQPFEIDLLRAETAQAPIRTSMMREQLNQTLTRGSFLADELQDKNRARDLAYDSAAMQYQDQLGQMNQSDFENEVANEIGIMMMDPVSPVDGVSPRLEALRALKEEVLKSAQEYGTTVGTDYKRVHNKALEALVGPESPIVEEMKWELSNPLDEALRRGETVTSIQRDRENNIVTLSSRPGTVVEGAMFGSTDYGRAQDQLEKDFEAEESAVEANKQRAEERLKQLKERKTIPRGEKQTHEDQVKEQQGIIDSANSRIADIRARKAAALKRLRSDMNRFGADGLPTGDGTPTNALVDPRAADTYVERALEMSVPELQ